MKSSVLIVFFALFLTQTIPALAQPAYYAKAQEIAALFPESPEDFRKDAVLFMRNESNPQILDNIEQMYYRNDGEVLRIVIRDFTENKGLYQQQKQGTSTTGPADISVWVSKPFRHHSTDEMESVAVFLDNYTVLEVIHENYKTSLLPHILEQLDITSINEFGGINP